MAQRFDGKVALITGGGSGIGKATALQMAREGGRVALLGVDRSSLNEVCEEIGDCARYLPLVADIRDAAALKDAIDEILRKWDRLDIVFANAGINGVWAPIDEIEPEEWDETLEIDLRGTFLTIKYAVPALKKQGGSIVITSSVNGTRMFSNSGATAYACSKAAQVALAKMLALELAGQSIRVNVICPGAILTAINDSTDKRHLQKIITPAEFPEGEIPLTHGEPGGSEDVAELVAFLCSDAAKHITGTEVWIDGAQSLLRG